jgi:hypothetical protein
MKNIIVSHRLSTTEKNEVITKSIKELKKNIKKDSSKTMNIIHKLASGISYKRIAKGYMLL